MSHPVAPVLSFPAGALRKIAHTFFPRGAYIPAQSRHQLRGERLTRTPGGVHCRNTCWNRLAVRKKRHIQNTCRNHPLCGRQASSNGTFLCTATRFFFHHPRLCFRPLCAFSYTCAIRVSLPPTEASALPGLSVAIAVSPI